jgi:hypothetical protein
VATLVGPDRRTISMTVTRRIRLITRFLGLRLGNIAANSTVVVQAIPTGDGYKADRSSASRGGSDRVAAA